MTTVWEREKDPAAAGKMGGSDCSDRAPARVGALEGFVGNRNTPTAITAGSGTLGLVRRVT
jgi:hypothetical protein